MKRLSLNFTVNIDEKQIVRLMDVWSVLLPSAPPSVRSLFVSIVLIKYKTQVHISPALHLNPSDPKYSKHFYSHISLAARRKIEYHLWRSLRLSFIFPSKAALFLILCIAYMGN